MMLDSAYNNWRDISAQNGEVQHDLERWVAVSAERLSTAPWTRRAGHTGHQLMSDI